MGLSGGTGGGFRWINVNTAIELREVGDGQTTEFESRIASTIEREEVRCNATGFSSEVGNIQVSPVAKLGSVDLFAFTGSYIVVSDDAMNIEEGSDGSINRQVLQRFTDWSPQPVT